MPHNPASLRLTDSYRMRLFALRDNLQLRGRDRWRNPGELAAMVEEA